MREAPSAQLRRRICGTSPSGEEGSRAGGVEPALAKSVRPGGRFRRGGVLIVSSFGALLGPCNLPLQAVSQVPAAARVFKVSTAADPGSAFVVGPTENGRCLLLTALHVIRVNAKNEPLLFQSPLGSSFNLRNTSFTVNEDLDLAFAPMPSCKESIGLPLARASSIVASQKIRVIGYPVDSQAAYGSKVVPSSVSGRITQFNDTTGYDLNYDASSKPGYSGGPVINDQGTLLLAVHGFSDTVGNSQDPDKRELLRVGGRGVSSALIFTFLKRYGYVLPRSTSSTPCLVGICDP